MERDHKAELVIIYGAGARGKGIYNFFARYGKEDAIKGFCDRNYENMSAFHGKKVMSFEEALKYELPFLISITDKDVDSVRQNIEREHGRWICLDDMAAFLERTGFLSTVNSVRFFMSVAWMGILKQRKGCWKDFGRGHAVSE